MQKLVDVAERITQNLRMAIAAEQIMRPAAYDGQLIDCFNVGQAGGAFDLVRHAILYFQVMALMRLWDDTGDDVRSILTLAHLLSDGGLIAKLVDRERRATHDTRLSDTTLGDGEEELPFSVARTTP